MNDLSRRGFLAGAAGSAVAAPALSAAPIGPQERFDCAVAEMKAAAEALYPTIAAWRFVAPGTEDVPVFLAAFTRKIDGD